MRRLGLLLLLFLTACQITAPIQPLPSAATPAPSASAVGQLEASESAVALAPTWTPAPTLTPTPQSTATLTPIPTLTPLPTVSPTTEPVSEPVMLIERPLPNEFVPATITVAGKVANVQGGTVTVDLRAPDGQRLGTPEVSAPTQPAPDGISFAVEVPLPLPPTPRPFMVYAAWSPEGGDVAAEAMQPINVLGRFPRVDRVTLDAPEPNVRGAEPTIAVRGVAPGPPAKVLVRMLDANDQVLESLEATLGWYQPGNPCDFGADLQNNPNGRVVQVITLGPDDQVIEAVRIPLGPAR